jgi:tetrahydromethanopterin S-methyltransferase subunit A
MHMEKIGYDPYLRKDVRKMRYEADELPKVQLFNSSDVIYGNPSSNVAVAFVYTWSTDTAPDDIRQCFVSISNYAALTGFWRTTNGTKYVFANILANPNINKLLVLVFGQRDNGHLLVDSLVNFWQSGTTDEGIVINSKAPNPKFEQVGMPGLERVRKQCDLVVARHLDADFARLQTIVSALIQEPENAADADKLGLEFYSNTIKNKKLYDDGARADEAFMIDLLHSAQNVAYEERELLPAIGQGVQAKNLPEALEQAAGFVFKNGTMFRDQRGILNVECRSLSITVVDALERLPEGFSKEYISKYVDEFMNGSPEKGDEFAYTYHERIFEKWGNQVEKAITLLKKHANTRRATISLWDSANDVERDSSPCLDFIWFVGRDGKLEMHALYRSHHLATVTKDGKVLAGEGALVPNVYALATLQEHVANEIGMKRGPLVVNDLSGHLYVSEV